MTQPDIPSIRNMIEIAQSKDTVAMCKCVSEHIQKRAKWKQFGEEGQSAVNENGQHKRGLHFNWGLLDGSNNNTFDPEKFTLVSGTGFKPQGGYYEGTIMPNKHNKYFSNGEGITDAAMRYMEPLHGGIVTDLYPDAKILRLNSQDDWFNVADKYKHVPNEEGIEELYWPSLLKDYDAVEFNVYHNTDDYAHNKEKYKSTYGNSGSMRRDPTDLNRHSDSNKRPIYEGRSNYRLILNPYAVMSSTPYNADNKDAEFEGKPTRTIQPRTTDWKPWDRNKSLDKLRERYKKEGVEVDW